MLANSSWIASNKRLPKRPPMGSCLSSSKVTMARLPRLAVTATWQTALVDNRTEEWRSYRLKTVRHLDCWTERDGSFAQSSGAKKGEKQLGRHHDMILMDRQTGMFLCTKATHKRLSVSSAHGHSPCCTTMRLTWTRLSWHCVFSPTTMALGRLWQTLRARPIVQGLQPVQKIAEKRHKIVANLWLTNEFVSQVQMKPEGLLRWWRITLKCARVFCT